MKELAARLWADLQTALKSSPLTRLSIRTKFLLMMLLASLAGLGIITYLASRTGKDALTEAAFTKLTSYRAAKKQQIEWYFNNLAETFSVLGTDRSLVSSFYDLRDGYEKLDEVPLTAERQQKLDAYLQRPVADIDRRGWPHAAGRRNQAATGSVPRVPTACPLYHREQLPSRRALETRAQVRSRTHIRLLTPGTIRGLSKSPRSSTTTT